MPRRLGPTKKLIVVACIAAIFFAAVPLTAHAACGLNVWCWISDTFFEIISSVLFIISWIISALAGIIIALESWLLQVVLSLNLNLVNSAPVKIGFPVVLSIANLAFVAGLIVIAIATILRQNNYGIKKILWKLVVMAILVNFGLVISGAMLNVADNLTLYFINSVNPGGTGESGNDFGAFASSMAGAFNPQGTFASKDTIADDPQGAADALRGFAGGAGEVGQDIGKWLVPFSALLGTIGGLFIIIVTLGTLIAMLLLRYVKLGMLLITLPLAWTAFVFPAFSHHHKKWWTSFSKWTIFAPVVVFFLWLALKISEVMNARQDEFDFTRYQSNASNGAWAGIANFFTNLFSPTVEQILRIIIIWGIMMGGLTAANELGIKFADAGIKAVDSARKWGTGFVGKHAAQYGKRGGRASYQKLGGRRLDKALSQGRLSKIPMFANLGRGIKDITQGKGGADVVAEEAKGIKAASMDELNDIAATGLRFPQQIAVALDAVKKGDLKKLKGVGGVSLYDWFQQNHQKLEDYGQKGLLDEFKKIGVTAKSTKALENNQWGDLAKEIVSGDAKKVGWGISEARNRVSNTDKHRFDDRLLRSMKEKWTPQNFADFIAGAKKEELETIQQVLTSLSGLNEEGLKDTIGPEILGHIRKSGVLHVRGISPELWGERVRRGEVVGSDPASRDEEGRHAAPPPEPPSGGEGGEGGGGH